VSDVLLYQKNVERLLSSSHLVPKSRAPRPFRRIARFRRAVTESRGQSVVEFALVLTPLMILMLAIVQLGLIFNGYVTLSNAVREGARTASIYVYDRNLSKAQNDTERAAAARTSLVNGLGILKRTAPQLDSAEPTITYSIPAGTADSNARVGQEVTVHVHYGMDLILPLIAQMLPLESGRLPLDASMTVVVN
jgi:Flp pilus assembly protein TadG